MGNSGKNIFIKHDVKVIDSFIDKFARKYIEQRSQTKTDISSLSENRVLLKQIYDDSSKIPDLKKTIRLIFIFINHTISSSNEISEEELETTYTLLKSIDIKQSLQRETFNEICGIEGIDSELLYFFYLSVIAIQNDKIINIRIDLLEYSENSLSDQIDQWQIRVTTKLLNTFIFLARKKNGFADVTAQQNTN